MMRLMESLSYMKDYTLSHELVRGRLVCFYRPK